MISTKTASAAILAAMLALGGPAFAQSSDSGGSSPSAGASDSNGNAGTGSTDTRAAPAGQMNPAAGDDMSAPEGRNTTTGTMGTSSTDNPGATTDQQSDTKSNRDCSSTQTPC